MGQAKLKQRAAFSPAVVEEWESEDCVNFAVALARVTGWLLHVDWWVPSTDPDNTIALEHCKPLRVYVADSGTRIFDVRGNRSLDDFNLRTIGPMARRHGIGGVRTRYYAEGALASLPGVISVFWESSTKFQNDPKPADRVQPTSSDN